jgi:hypothetical protein
MVPFERQITLKKGQKCVLVLLGDIHWNLDACNHQLFDDLIYMLADHRKHKDLVRVIGMGDYVDCFSTSERAALAGIHDSSLEQLDKWVMELMQKLARKLEPLKGCVDGLLEGHHWHKFEGPDTRDSEGKRLYGVSSTEYFCKLLDAQYLGLMTMGTWHINGYPLRLLAHHGYGFARSKPGKIRKRTALADEWISDIYALGHEHALFIEEDDQIAQAGKGIKSHNRYFVGTGSYPRGYSIGTPYGGYVEARLLPPNDLGSPIFEISAESKGLKIKAWPFK